MHSQFFLHIFYSIISDEILRKILDLPILVVLDEAYIEFSGLESRMKWVKQHENLIVLRTFSKRAGSDFGTHFYVTCAISCPCSHDKVMVF